MTEKNCVFQRKNIRHMTVKMKFIVLHLFNLVVTVQSFADPKVLVGNCNSYQHSGSWISGNTHPQDVKQHPISHFRSFLPRPLQQSATATADSTTSLKDGFPRISISDIRTLSEDGYVVIPNFLSPDLVSALREDVNSLRSSNNFKVARIGQDSTNNLNTDIRVAETCFLGENKMELARNPNEARENLYKILDTVRGDLSGNSMLDTYSDQKELVQCAPALDTKLTELLYAYYPEGGFYRRHRDAIVGSASILRSYSLLLYINDMEWNEEDGGALRIHL